MSTTLKDLKFFTPICIDDIFESKYKHEDILTFVWHDGEDRDCAEFGISDIDIQNGKFNHNMYNISWHFKWGDPEIKSIRSNQKIHKLGDGEWEYGLYVHNDLV